MKFDITAAWRTIYNLVNEAIAHAPNVLLGIIVFFAFTSAGAAVRNFVRRVTLRVDRHHSLGLVLGRLVHGVFIVLGLLFALSIVVPSFKAADVISLFGIGSVAIGFAFRDILQNFLAGILILLTEPFRVGDQIIVTDFEGTVEEIQTRATLIRTYDDRRVVIPNANMFTQSVTVNTAFEYRRTQYDVGIGYGDDVEAVSRMLLAAMAETKGVLAAPPPEVRVQELGPSAVSLRALWWTQPKRSDVMVIRSRVLSAFKDTLTANGVDLPFPTQQVLFHDQTEEGDGDRARQREGWPAGKSPAPRGRTIAGALEQLVEALRDRPTGAPGRERADAGSSSRDRQS